MCSTSEGSQISDMMISLSVLVAALQVVDSTAIVDGAMGRQLDAAMRRAEAHGFAGSVIVARGDTVLLRQAYGLANRDTRAPLVPSNALMIGSVAKQFVATAVMTLVADGRLRLTDSLYQHVPDAPVDKRNITMRQLLSHTAGLVYLVPFDGRDLTRAELMRQMLAVPLQSPPGTVHSYSNTGFAILAALVEQWSGQPYETYVKRRLFDRAGLRSTYFMGDRRRMPLVDQQVHSYSGDQDEGTQVDFPIPGFIFGSGDILSTPDDLYRWVRAVLRGDVLPPTQRDLLFTPVTDTPQRGAQYALGWNVNRLASGTTLIVHGGDLGGYNAELRHYMGEGLTIVVLGTQRLRGVGTKAIIANELSNVYHGRPGMPIPALAERPAEGMRALSGRYMLPSGGRVVVVATGGSLQISTADAEGFRALFGGDSTMTAREVRWSRGADTLLALLRHDSIEVLVQRYHPATRGGDLVAALRDMRQELFGTRGTLRRVRVVGSRVLGATAGATDAVLEFEKGAVPVSMAWEGDVTWGIVPRQTMDLPLALAVESATSATAYDLMSGRLVRIAREGNALLISTPMGTTRATVEGR
jgi:CubicO group peptidase (beta-lactamase class C family)